MQKQCSKCCSKTQLEKHHIYPQTFYGKRHNRTTILLCHECHLKIETILLSVESYKGNVAFGTRHKLHKEDYTQIHRNWLRNPKINFT